jgi:regulator of protease activity HflC (stomatin/prohibitin superfamily)
MNLRRGILLFALLALVVPTSACWQTVEPGYVGIKVNKHGNQRGVEDFPISTGRVTYNPFTETVYTFPTFMQRVPWTADVAEGSPNDESISFNSIEGALINLDIAFAGSFTAETVPAIFVEFRKPASLIVDGWVRDQVRNCLNSAGSTRKAVQILGEGKMDFLQAANACVSVAVTEKGFAYDSISILGEARVDDRVRQAIAAVIEQTQAALKAEAKVRQAEAEAQQVAATAEGERLKLIAEAAGRAESTLVEARAQAEANRIVAESLTPLLVEYKALDEWNGQPPHFVSGDSGGAVPFVNLTRAND